MGPGRVGRSPDKTSRKAHDARILINGFEAPLQRENPSRPVRAPWQVKN